MKYRRKKLITLSLLICMFGMLATGCGSAPAGGNEGNAPTNLDMPEPITDEAKPDTDETKDGNGNDTSDAEGVSETSGKWHVFDSDLAAAVDADFEGVVFKIDTDSFFIYPAEVSLDENGGITSSSFAPGVEIPDEELLEVVFDSDTVFTLQDIYDGGNRKEDSEASFQSIEKGLSIDLKGEFQNDIFYAASIRIIKVH